MPKVYANIYQDIFCKNQVAYNKSQNDTNNNKFRVIGNIFKFKFFDI